MDGSHRGSCEAVPVFAAAAHTPAKGAKMDDVPVTVDPQEVPMDAPTAAQEVGVVSVVAHTPDPSKE